MRQTAALHNTDQTEQTSDGMTFEELAEDAFFDEFGAYCPTARRIADQCALIQAQWSPRERTKRYVGDAGDLRWMLPVCRHVG